MMSFREYAEQQGNADLERVDKMYQANMAALQSAFDASVAALSRNYKVTVAEIKQHYGFASPQNSAPETMASERPTSMSASMPSLVPKADDVLSMVARRMDND